MEREVGEVFDFKGVKLQVKNTGCNASCNGCCFNGPTCKNNEINYMTQTGECFLPYRTDDKNVIFVEVKQ